MQKTKTSAKNAVDLDDLARVGGRLKALIDQLGAIFPERETLLKQAMYALLTKEHVLVFGTFGTGKSDLLGCLFEAIEGSRAFGIALSKYMTEANVIGIPDPSRMREEGVIHYRRDGGILDADFVELDEMLDANWPLLRCLLGILNERQFKRGRQVEDAKLHTAVACTNGDPVELVKKEPQLGAVVDRFMFHCKVQYLTTEDSRMQMYDKYLHGALPTAKIALDDLKRVSDVCTEANQIDDERIVRTFDRVVQAFIEKTKKVVSDRRRCKLLQIVEAAALLNGRYDVHEEDILEIRWGLCTGGLEAEFKAFDEVAKPIVEKAIAERPQSVDEVQVKLLKQFEASIPVIDACDDAELLTRFRAIKKLLGDVDGVRPQLPSTQKLQKEILLILKARESKALERLGSGAS